MDHPSREQWMGFLYDEPAAPERERLADHLSACGQCREAVGRWRAAMARLDTWQAKVPQRRAAGWRRPAAVAAAAAALLMVGVAVGRLAAPRGADVEALRASLQKQMTADWQASLASTREELRREMEAQVESAVDEVRAATNGSLIEFARSFDRVRRSDLATLAALTEQELWRTKWQVAVALASPQYGAQAAPAPESEKTEVSHSNQ